MTKPDFFMVGAPRCGTTAMHSILAQHPEIFMIDLPGRTIKGNLITIREIHYFGSDTKLWWFPTISEEEYLGFFFGVTDEKRVGERSVSYLGSKQAASEIKAFAPSASIIIILRNPVDLLHSAHTQNLYNGYEEIVDFEEALITEADRTCDRATSEDGVQFVNAALYREMVHFTPQVRRYFDIFGRDNVHVIIHDDLIRDSAGIYREVLRFLGVDDSFEVQIEVLNPRKRAHSALLREPPALARSVGRFLLPKPVRRGMWRVLGRLNEAVEKRQPLAPEVRRRVLAQYANEVEDLSELLDRDLGHWLA